MLINCFNSYPYGPRVLHKIIVPSHICDKSPLIGVLKSVEKYYNWDFQSIYICRGHLHADERQQFSTEHCETVLVRDMYLALCGHGSLIGPCTYACSCFLYIYRGCCISPT